MSIYTKIGCVLIGWDAKILATCGEASKRQFRKLLSALAIMMILWGTIGYCFAEDYLNITSFIGRAGITLAFVAIILCIERVIILTVGKNRMMGFSRILLAICMALLGACIFDQLIFRNDIQQQISDNREDKIIETTEKRLGILNKDVARVQSAIDSIGQYNDILYKEIAQNPTTTVTAVSSQQVVVGTDDKGNPIKTTVNNVNKQIVANPRIAQAEENEKQIQNYIEQLETLRIEKNDIGNKVREELTSRPTGFIEELEATIQVISNSVVSLVFYCVLFSFLLFLELFVLTIKMGETPCDYDLIVEHQLNHKKRTLHNTELSLAN